MKLVKAGVFLAWLLAGGAGAFAAQDKVALSRTQWLTKIGVSVSNESVLRETLGQVADDDKIEFTQRLLKAVTRMPVRPEEKAAAFVRASVATIKSVNGELKYKVIAEVFASVPVEFLPVVTDELAKRFNQEYNHLTDEQYEKIASEAVRVAIARNVNTDAPTVRNTFVILAFLRGAKNPKLKDVLLALLPDERSRNLVASWLPAALDGNYDALLAAADVESLKLSVEDVLQLVGHATLDRLLSSINSDLPLSSLIGGNINNKLPTSGIFDPIDFGINRLPTPGPIPTGYQNQTTDVRGCACKEYVTSPTLPK